MNGGLRGTPTANCLKNVAQMDKANPYKNGIPKDLPNKTKDNHWVGVVDEKQAEESLSLYCKPVELYNLIQQRSEQKPLFLQRCLSYKQSAAWQRRIRITISVTGYALGKSRGKDSVTTNGTVMCSVFVMVTTPVTRPVTCSTERSVEAGLQGQVYRLRKTQILKIERSHHSPSTEVSFILPELRKLMQGAENRDVVLFVVCESLDGGKVSHVTTLEKCTGCVVWGKMGISSLFVNMLRNTKDDAQRKTLDGSYAEIKSNVDLRLGNLQLEDANVGKTIRISTSTERSLVQLSVIASGVEVGRTTVQGRPTNGPTPKSHLPYSLSHAWRPRIGRVVFHYIYYHDMRRKTEVTEGFSCPFCLNGCASFKGLRGHLNASHDLFNFEYLVSGELQVVNVTCRSDVIGSQGNIRDVDGLSDPRMKNFCYWNPRSRLRRRRLPVSLGDCLQDGKLPSTWMQQTSDLAEEPDLQLRSDLQETADLNNESVDTTILPVAELPDASDQRLGDPLFHEPSIKVANGITMKGLKHGNNVSSTPEHKRLHDADCLALAVKQRDVHAPKRQRMKGVLGERVHARSRPTFGGACASAGGGQDLDDCGQQQTLTMTTKALFADIPRIHNLLQKRQYFHSHTAQPMDAEQLFGDRDSEDEVDTVIADLEDRRMLDDFVDVTPEEKEVMHLWNSFVRRNRVVADGHCLWACGEFSRENAQRFGENPALRRCLMLFLVKLWNHHLVDGPTISQCLAIVDSYGSKEQEEQKK